MGVAVGALVVSLRYRRCPATEATEACGRIEKRVKREILHCIFNVHLIVDGRRDGERVRRLPNGGEWANAFIEVENCNKSMTM